MGTTWAILQARMGSSRFPGKVLAPMAGMPMLGLILTRLSACELIDGVCVATTNLAADDPIADYCAGRLACDVFRGSSEDVLCRFARCAETVGAETVVRLTADNPFVDPSLVQEALGYFKGSGGDYLRYRSGLPLGLGIEVLSRSALDRADAEATDAECREHVTPYLYRNPGRFFCIEAPADGPDYSHVRLTVDTVADYETACALYGTYDHAPESLTWLDAVHLAEKQPELVKNASVRQNKVAYEGEEV